MSELRTHASRAKHRIKAGIGRLERRFQYPNDRITDLPIVFGNAMAKAGSHILLQYLEGLCLFTPLIIGDPYPIRTITASGRKRSDEEVYLDLRRLRPGDIGWGYLPGKENFIREIVGDGRINYFIYRDPRDKIISHIFYAMDIHEGHAMRDYYFSLSSMEARITSTITGVPGLIQNIRASYDSYLAWFDQPDVLTISFEDLVNSRKKSLTRMIAHIERNNFAIPLEKNAAFDILNQAMSPERSSTFRAGRSGGWNEYFSKENIELFKEVTGDLLVKLGYEASGNW
jgi:hypothetical protein